MNRKNNWKWALVIFLTVWSLWELYPPMGRDLVQVFEQESIKKDAAFTQIVTTAKELQKTRPNRAYANLVDAIGTNDLRPYFAYDVKSQNDPNIAILSKVQKKAGGKLKLGLDLQGGIQFTVRLDTSKVLNDTNKLDNLEEEKTRAVSQAVEVLRKRVDRFGVAEPLIQPMGKDRVLIQLPGLSESDKESAKQTIQKAAFLEFRMVHKNSMELLQKGIVPPRHQLLRAKTKHAQGVDTYEPYIVENKPYLGLTGKHIKRAYVIRDHISNRPQINFEMQKDGVELFAKATRENIGRQLAIVLDGELYSAPVIQGEIDSGRGQISLGNNPDIAEAFELANVLENPLETPVEIIDFREVDPTLGKDSISSGIRSAVIGTLLVGAFMAMYYMRAGVIANIAMLLNLVILLGVMCSISTTLTLPGIAGIVLTVGMAVDANVLIYERLREELGLGKSMRNALSAAYSRAFSTIFDSHITTLICAVILIYMGTGPIKGFGVTLTIGVALSLFTALVVTRLIFDFLLERNWLNKLSMMHVIQNPRVDFMKLAKPAFAISWAIILIGIGYGVFVRGNSVMGVDFAGGDSLLMRVKQKTDVDQVRSALEKAKVGEATIQYQKGLVDDNEQLAVVVPYGKSQLAEDALKQSFPNAGIEVIGRDSVGPTVGIEIQKSAIIATLLSLFGILLYVAFRYEFSFSVGAVVAVIHDVLMTLGIFFLSGRQLSAPMVAAVLTIIGFSINDTIVIFDRIREDLKLGVRGSFRELINRALNQTLSRTIITSGTVLLATLSLYIFGGGVINDFAFTFLVGILTGTYSSVYIASALVLWWHKGQRPSIATPQVVVDNTVTAQV